MIEFQRVTSGACRALVNRDFAESLTPLLAGGDEGIASLFAASRPGTSGSGRASTRILALPGHSRRVHLREARRGGWLGALLPRRVLGESRARRELELTAALFDLRAPVVLPVLLAGRRTGLFWDGVVGSLHQEDALDARRFLGGSPDRERVLHATRNAARAVRTLHDAGVDHRDLHVGNLLISSDGDSVQVIDLDGARQRPSVRAASRMRQLMRLYRSLVKWKLEEVVGARGCAVFLAAYCGGDRTLRRALLRSLRRERLRLAFHRIGYSRRRQLQ